MSSLRAICILVTTRLRSGASDVPVYRRVATCYDLRGCPEKPGWGQLEPVDLVEHRIHDYAYVQLHDGLRSEPAIDSAINKLESAGDKAKHQVKELRDAQGYVNTGELSFGEYHGAAVIYGETAKEALENADRFASRSRNECGVEWVARDGGLLRSRTSHKSRARKVKPRPKVQSSRNFAAMHACHDYSTGKAEGNPIGDGSAVIPFRTAAGSVYHGNYHATRLGDINVAEKMAGHLEARERRVAESLRSSGGHDRHAVALRPACCMCSTKGGAGKCSFGRCVARTSIWKRESQPAGRHLSSPIRPTIASSCTGWSNCAAARMASITRANRSRSI